MKSFIKTAIQSWMRWFMPVILEPKRLMQKNCEFEASLGYIAKPCLKNKRETKQNNAIPMYCPLL
jgi:hypothetical protein